MKSATITDTSSTAYRQLVDELAILTDLSNRLAALEVRFQEAHAELVNEAFRADFAELQDSIGSSESRIELLATQHPEWFEKTKTVKTPFGQVSFRSSTKLEVPNEEASIAVLETMGEDGKPYLRQRTFLNLEALEGLEDADLKKLRIKRVTRESCLIYPAKVDLGKAVKKSAD
jgi:phage host-nuclease inhibitor protein Gam